MGGLLWPPSGGHGRKATKSHHVKMTNQMRLTHHFIWGNKHRQLRAGNGREGSTYTSLKRSLRTKTFERLPCINHKDHLTAKL